MNVLWIVHDVLPKFIPFVSGKYTVGGSWIGPLFYSLSKSKNVKLGIIAPVVKGKNVNKEIDGIQYYSIPIEPKDNISKLSRRNIDNYLQAIKDFDPDIIHVHGIEKNFGLLTKYVDKEIPVVCSLQGIINPYLEYLKMSVSHINLKKFRSLKNMCGIGGLNRYKKGWNKYSRIEKEIISVNKYFIGRTLWDKSQILAMNPNASYFHGEELLRDEFYNQHWEINNCEPHSIFISSGAYPIKGLHLLLDAVNILKSKYPDLKVYAPLVENSNNYIRNFLFGDDYNNYIKYLVKRYSLQSNIIFLPRLSAKEMADEYLSSSVFVLPSYIENSPNSLGEAMQIGVPTVVAYSGGIGSIVNKDSSLLFPIGDYRLCAYHIDRIFQSKELSLKLSNNSKLIANKRHDRKKVTESYVHTYKEIVSLHKMN